MAGWDDKGFSDEELLEVIGPFRDLRTSWKDLEGQIVFLSVSSSLGFREIDHFWQEHWVKESGLPGRIVGLETSGIWFEVWMHLAAIKEGKRPPEEHLRFFVPFESIRGVKVKAIRREGLATASAPQVTARAVGKRSAMADFDLGKH